MATRVEPLLKLVIQKNVSLLSSSTQGTSQRHLKFLTCPSKDVSYSFNQTCIYCFPPTSTQMKICNIYFLCCKTSHNMKFTIVNI